jgi:hypothetical protein
VKLLFASRKVIQPNDEVLQYHGPAGALDTDRFRQVLSGLAVVKPLFARLPSGGVLRDQRGACSWAKWHCDYQDQCVRDGGRHHYRHVIMLVTDRSGHTLNIVSRIYCTVGEGSDLSRAFVTRTSEDEYACFEY